MVEYDFLTGKEKNITCSNVNLQVKHLVELLLFLSITVRGEKLGCWINDGTTDCRSFMI